MVRYICLLIHLRAAHHKISIDVPDSLLKIFDSLLAGEGRRRVSRTHLFKISVIHFKRHNVYNCILWSKLKYFPRSVQPLRLCRIKQAQFSTASQLG